MTGYQSLPFFDQELAQMLEATEAATTIAHIEAKARLFPESGATVEDIGDGVAVFAGAGSPINRVHNLGMRQPVTSGILASAEAFYAARHASCPVDLCPLADPSLIRALGARGYTVAAFKHVWLRETGRLAGLPVLAPAIRVEIVPPEEATLWAKVVAHSFAGGNPAQTDLEIPLPNAHKSDTTVFLAWLEDQPAGGGALALRDGLGICFSTSVRPELRRMGVQTALLHARLRFAAESGCQWMMVQTSPGSPSQRNVERFGFRLVYTKPTMVKHPGGQGAS